MEVIDQESSINMQEVVKQNSQSLLYLVGKAKHDSRNQKKFKNGKKKKPQVPYH